MSVCGIVGYVASQPEPGLDAAFLARACRAMSHRGPDGDGQWSEARVGLGHRRLSIIDLAGGAQPMSYADGRYWITFNGEIYNYRELRAELAARGHAFRTRSDTEVILAAVAEWGPAAPARLRGIFAFGIWDRREERLLLARDHLGVKPLLYHHEGGHVVFSSELKAILEAEGVPRDVDPEAVADYLALGYVLGPKTLLGAVRRLPPGCTLCWHDGRVTVTPFWDLASAACAVPAELGPGSANRLVEEYGAHLTAAVARQMVSDVPVGALLSGGVDSSSIAYHMRAETPHRLKTFSMGFAEPSFSELDWAGRVAAALGTEHHAEVVDPELGSTLPALVRAFDEPLGDTSIVPTYFVSLLARRHVKVVLSGDGADESLAGYDTYVADSLQQLYRRLPGVLHRRLLLPVSRLIPAGRKKVSLNYKVRQFVAQAHAALERAHYGWRLLFEPAQRTCLLAGAAAGYDPFDVYRTYYERVRPASLLNQNLYVDINTWLANDILTKVDRASMAVGLEARVPFLDVDLVEFTMRLPVAMKMRGLRRKRVLKAAMRGKLPTFVLDRRKSGFNAPVTDWLRGSLRGMAEDLFGGPSCLVDLGHPLVKDLWRAHLSRKQDHGFQLWSLLTLLLWEREVLRRRPATPIVADDPRPESARVATVRAGGRHGL